MELVSINIATIKTIEHNGKQVPTGIFKQPTTGSVYVGKYNLEGDNQADLKNHGGRNKAIYGFSQDHYPYWASVLNNPHLEPGAFGENLTITNLDESRIHIGDQFRLGECLLEVSQPRVPCFKLGIALNNMDIPQQFIEQGETGVYFRVIEEGSIKAGDQLELVASEPSKIAVKSLFRAYFDKDHSRAVEVLKTAVELPQLAEEWRAILPKRIAKLS